jgi:hypothetical protein
MIELTLDEKAELRYIMDGSGAAPFTGMIFNAMVHGHYAENSDISLDNDEDTRMMIRAALRVKTMAREMTK